jgi:hypothetical protein
LKALRPLAGRWPETSIAVSADCENLQPGVYLAVAAITADREKAGEAAARLRTEAGSAHVRECRPKPGSRIALGVPAVDASIRNVPDDAVNWTDDDRVSTVVKLPGSGYLWVRRTYEAAREDPREGRRESVLYFAADPRQARTLDADCTGVTWAARGTWIALSCAREVAADHLLHQTTVFDRNSGKPALTLRRCRDPRFASETEVSCMAEQVDADGNLRLAGKKASLPQ